MVVKGATGEKTVSMSILYLGIYTCATRRALNLPMEFLTLCFTTVCTILNYFEFNDKIYRQELGTAVGTKFAPAYANFFMGRLEERLLEASVDKPLVWMRFINDVFFIWAQGEEKLKLFVNFINSSHETIGKL